MAYSPQEPLTRAATAGVSGAVVGTIVSALRNALGTHTHGAIGVLTRTGGTIGLFAAVGFTFAYTDSFVANQRQKNDAVNGAAGACAAAFLGGLRTKSLPIAVSGCAVMAAVVGGYDYVGSLAPVSPETALEKRKKFFKNPPDFTVDARTE